MNRTLTAGVAIAAALGTAGLAMAQGNIPNTNVPQSPGMTAPSPMPNTGVSPNGGYQPPNTTGSAQQSSQQLTSPASIMQAQQQLRAQGLYNGAIDGRAGPELKTALMQFQERNGLPQTGILDQQTSVRLQQSSNNGLGPTPTSGSTMQGTGTTQSPATPLTNR
jgi:peptidoglycan hydrolase-like protein with peptidoglycan-binding domain